MKKVTIDFYEHIDQPLVTLGITYHSYKELAEQMDQLKGQVIIEVRGQPTGKQVQLLKFLENYQTKSKTVYLIHI